MSSAIDFDALLELSKQAANQAGQRLLEGAVMARGSYTHCADNVREIKALADYAMEQDILQAIGPTGLPILSEESGYRPSGAQSDYWFIVDPLDGTFNYVKGLGPCAVSIALWQGQKPIFGVIYSVLDQELFWGGKNLGSFSSSGELSVSRTNDKKLASICTGFPARLDVSNEQALIKLWDVARHYAKVRMIGSAAISLLHVARGAADAYAEQNIMLWDVAAGLAIVEGAGGYVHSSPGTIEYSLDVFADNGVFLGLDHAPT